MFTLDLPRLKQQLDEANAKRVLFLLPEGVLDRYVDIENFFKSCDIETFILGDEHWGGCDIPIEAFEDLSIDTIVSFGHTEYFRKDRERILFFPMNFVHRLTEASMGNLLDPLVNGRFEKMSIAWSTEFQDYAQPILQFLESKVNVSVPQSDYLVTAGQVLGCHYSKLTRQEQDVDCFLVVSDAFHSSGLLYETVKPVFWFDPYNARLIDISPWREPLIEKRRNLMETAMRSRRFGIVIEKRYGQQRVNLARKLRSLLLEQGYEVSLLYMSDVTPAKLQRYRPFIDIFVNTACPRIESFEESGVYVLNSEETQIICGKVAFDEVYPGARGELNHFKLRVSPQSGNVECGSVV
ncbi:diphthamide synthesis protein [Nostoc sp. C117]|uniref:diphthamide synthesis protein n=1 Tax=Nostoc sp. C117 TaxID=3349875 RepID=UPI00370D14DC